MLNSMNLRSIFPCKTSLGFLALWFWKQHELKKNSSSCNIHAVCNWAIKYKNSWGSYTYFSDQIDVSLSWTESIEIKTTNVIIISWSLDLDL